MSYGYFRNFVKVIKCSFRVATDIFGFINYNPSLTIKLPYIELLKKQRRHVYTNEEIDLILTRFMNNEPFTCLFITVCYTGMRPSEACALTWNDVNLEKRIITIKHNVYPKVKDEKGKWFIGTPKTDTSNREIYICDTLFQALHNFKSNQEKHKKYYNSKYHYYHLEEVKNKFGKVVEHRLIESKRKNRNQEIFDLVFVNKDGSYSGTDITKYPYKVIRNELGIINCRFYDLRGSYATKSLRNGAYLRDVAVRSLQC